MVFASESKKHLQLECNLLTINTSSEALIVRDIPEHLKKLVELASTASLCPDMIARSWLFFNLPRSPLWAPPLSVVRQSEEQLLYLSTRLPCNFKLVWLCTCDVFLHAIEMLTALSLSGKRSMRSSTRVQIQALSSEFDPAAVRRICNAPAVIFHISHAEINHTIDSHDVSPQQLEGNFG